MIATKLKVRTFGDPCLERLSEQVQAIGPAERMLIESMIKTMYVEDGVGLAAPQVGINRRIFVADIGDGPMAVVNPKILKKEGTIVMEEGCLSVPGINVEIERPHMIRLHYLDENGMQQEKDLTDLKARVVLHEMDHLDGKMIIDYIAPSEREKFIRQFKEKSDQK